MAKIWIKSSFGVLSNVTPTSHKVIDNLQVLLTPAFHLPWTSHVHFNVFTLFYGLPRWCSGEESDFQCWRCKRRGFNPGLPRSLGRGNDSPLWYSYLENSMDRGTYRAVVYGVTKSQTWLYKNLLFLTEKVRRKKKSWMALFFLSSFILYLCFK